MLFWGTNVTPQNMESNYYGEETYEIERNIEDGKVVYSIVASGDYNVKIIVEASDHIIVSGVQDGQPVEISLYKYSSANN